MIWTSEQLLLDTGRLAYVLDTQVIDSVCEDTPQLCGVDGDDSGGNLLWGAVRVRGVGLGFHIFIVTPLLVWTLSSHAEFPVLCRWWS